MPPSSSLYSHRGCSCPHSCTSPLSGQPAVCPSRAYGTPRPFRDEFWAQAPKGPGAGGDRAVAPQLRSVGHNCVIPRTPSRCTPFCHRAMGTAHIWPPRPPAWPQREGDGGADDYSIQTVPSLVQSRPRLLPRLLLCLPLPTLGGSQCWGDTHHSPLSSPQVACQVPLRSPRCACLVVSGVPPASPHSV